MMEKVIAGFFSIGVVFAAFVWFNWVDTNDDHLFTVAQCMSKVQHKQNVSPQEAFILCEREER